MKIGELGVNKNTGAQRKGRNIGGQSGKIGKHPFLSILLRICLCSLAVFKGNHYRTYIVFFPGGLSK